jgi:hypothetical protein
VLLIVAGVGVYLVLTTRPAYYSPADVVRKSSDYQRKLNPPRVAMLATNASPITNLTITTNFGKVRLEYPVTQPSSVEVINFTVHHLTNGELAQLGGTSIRLRRIGQAWAPPGTNSQSSYHNNIPAQFYDADLKILSDAEVVRAMPERWDRTVDCQDNRPTVSFDLEIRGDPWKVLGAGLYDARSQQAVSSGWSSRQSKDGYRYDMHPYIWHYAPVEFMVDLGLGPVTEEEISPQPGSHFQVGPCRYQLIFAGDGYSAGSYSSSSGATMASFELSAPVQQQASRKECVFLFHSSPTANHSVFELEYLDAAGKKIETSGGSSSGSQILQGVRGELAAVKKIRVRKYSSGHRVVIRLPGLPGLPPENQQVDNLFRVRAPLLRFDREYEQQEYIRRVTQLDMVHISTPNLPAGTYPRWFTNATPVEVLEDYAHVMGIQGQLYVNQEKLLIEKGKLPWPLEAQEKLLKLWKKLRGP